MGYEDGRLEGEVENAARHGSRTAAKKKAGYVHKKDR